MGFLHDAIMESNDLEFETLFKKLDLDESKLEEKVCDESCEDDKLEEENKVDDMITEELVDIEDYLPKEAYIEESLKKSINENVTELPDRYAKGRPGSPEYDANENRRKREAMYRKYANIDEDYEITEDNINQRAFDKTCTMQHCDGNRLKAELLKQPYTGLEKYSED